MPRLANPIVRRNLLLFPGVAVLAVELLRLAPLPRSPGKMRQKSAESNHLGRALNYRGLRGVDPGLQIPLA